MRSSGRPAEPPIAAICNDDVDACEVVARAVELHGFRAARVPNPGDLLEVIVSERPSVVLVDLLAGVGTNAMSVLETIRTHPNEVVATSRIVIVGNQPRQALFAWQAGTDGFLVRPFHADELAQALRDAAERPERDRQSVRLQAQRDLARQPAR